MSFAVFKQFPSDDYLKTHHKLASKFDLLNEAFLRTGIFNLVAYVDPLMTYGSDVKLVELQSSGALRRSMNPIRYLIGFPFVFSYIRAIQNAWAITPNDQYKEWRKAYFESIVRPFIHDIHKARRAESSVTCRLTLVHDGIILKPDLTPYEATDPELAAEIVACAQLEQDDPKLRIVAENGNVFIEVAWSQRNLQDVIGHQEGNP